MATRLREAATLEARTQALGRELFERARREHAQLTTLNRWTRQVLTWCLSDPHLKSQVLRFIDSLPTLHTPEAIVRHLREYFPTDSLRLPTALRLGVSLARPGLLTAPAASVVVRQLVEQVARQFIAGSRVEDAVSVTQRLAAQGAMASFDVLGEQVTSEEEAQRYAEQYTTLITQVSQASRTRAQGNVHENTSSSVRSRNSNCSMSRVIAAPSVSAPAAIGRRRARARSRLASKLNGSKWAVSAEGLIEM